MRVQLYIRLIIYEYNVASKNCSRLYDGWTCNEMLEFCRVAVQLRQLIDSGNMWIEQLDQSWKWIGQFGKKGKFWKY